MELMRELDSIGVHRRRCHRLQRRVYLSKVSVLIKICFTIMTLILVYTCRVPTFAGMSMAMTSWHLLDSMFMVA